MEVSVATVYASCVTFAFNSAAGRVPLQNPREAAYRGLYHLDPGSSAPYPDRILITH